MAESLEKQARRFAHDISDLLNRTVTDGIRVSSLKTATGYGIIGAGVSKNRSTSLPIPITPMKKDAVVFLYLLHSYEPDPEGVYLTMTQTTMSLYTSAAMEDEQLIVGIDYARNPGNQFPGAHLHVAGQRDDLDAVYLVEFMVTEEMVDPRTGWEQVVKDRRARWEAIQLKAAVRRNQEDAAAALREAGWDAITPAVEA